MSVVAAFTPRSSNILFNGNKYCKGIEPFKLSIITATRNRSHLLRNKALASLLKQTKYSFEWVVVNDGGDPATKEIVQDCQFPFPHQYVEIEHPIAEFGLCVARNVGIDLAKGDLLTYLDDDNSFYPQFVETLDSLVANQPSLGVVIPQQLRRRDAIVDGHLIRKGKPFVSPKCGTSIAELLAHRALIDSNGLIHPCADAPRWNPSYRIYCDYEYFLQCLQLTSMWASPIVLEAVLVKYIQSSEGEIGGSSYADWADELQRLYDERERFTSLNSDWAAWMPAAIAKYRNKAKAKAPIPAFHVSSSLEVSHAE